MGQDVKLSIAGLYSQPSLIGEDIPEGALVTADNVVINREGIIEPRRGFSSYATSYPTRIGAYQDRIVGHANGFMFYDNGSGTFTILSGTFNNPSSSAKTRFVQAAQNLYFTTALGVYRMDVYSANPLLAGAIKAVGFDSDPREYTSSAGQMSLTGNVVTVAATTAAHGFYVGQVVTQTSATEAPYAAGSYTVATVPSATSFTYPLTAGNDAGNASAHTFTRAHLVTAGGFLADASQVAYRAVFNCPDTNNREKPGAASARIVIANVSGTPGWVTAEAKNVVVRIFVPSGVTTSFSCRLYRSKQVASTIEPEDELQLVYEATVKAPEITQGWMDITDVTPDALRGPIGYFAPSQEGIIQNNERPPLSKDIATFGGSMHYANTTGIQRFTASILAVGGTGGIQDGDSITFISQAYTARTTPTGQYEYKLFTAGTTSANMRNTALSLCSTINRDSASTVKAYYISGPDEAPGRILIEATTAAIAAFQPIIAAETAGEGKRLAWNPVPAAKAIACTTSRTTNVVTATPSSTPHNFLVGEQVTNTAPAGTFGAGPHTITAVTTTTFTFTETAADGAGTGTYASTIKPSSAADTIPNRIYHSKNNQPEAVPFLNYTDVGSKDGEILRIVPLRDSIFCFKEDGLYRGTGGNGTFRWDLFDPTIVLLAADSAVTLGNQIYAWTSQGVVAISDTGAAIVSQPIKKTLNDFLVTYAAEPTYLPHTYGLGYETEHRYELHFGGDASKSTTAYIYNTTSRAWTREPHTSYHGLIHPVDGKRYLAGFTCASAVVMAKERKTGTYADYADIDLSVTISSNSGVGTIVLSSATGVEVGDIIYRLSASNCSRITAVNGTTLTLAAEDVAAWPDLEAGSATVAKAIATTVRWAPFVAGNPAASKLFRETNLLLGNAHIGTATISHSTELRTTLEATTVDGAGTIGQQTRSYTLWGGTEIPFNLRVMVPQEMRRAARLHLQFAVTNTWSVWNISGLSILFNSGSPATSR